MKLTPEQVNDIIRLKSFRPYMIVGGALHPTTGEFRLIAKSTMHTFNRLAREGWTVEVIQPRG